MQDSAAATELCGLALITCSFGQVVECLLARNFYPIVSKVGFMIADIITRCAFAVYASQAYRYFFRAGACSETTNDSLWSMCGLHSGPHHLRKQVHIVISLTRHLFANRVQDF